jgi:hypothetical protein
MKVIINALTCLVALGLPSFAQQAPAPQPRPDSDMAEMHHAHQGGLSISYADLKDTVTRLERARQATQKYHDVRVAEADGYRQIGPDVPGMGVHFVLATQQDHFDVEKPPILLYEKDPARAGGYSLVGVSYLLEAPEGPDGQPLTSPFPKALAVWHRHKDICVLPDRTTPTGLTEGRCHELGGRFTTETQWMVHAWIWKDSPLGVFSPTNPAVL